MAPPSPHSYTMALPTFAWLSAFFSVELSTEYISDDAVLSAVPSAARILSSLICTNGAGTRW